MRKLVEKEVYECDGCQYALNPERMITLELKVEDGDSKYKIPFHFHPVSKDHDCLRYWMNGTYVLERSLKERDTPQNAKDLILRSLSFIRGEK